VREEEIDTEAEQSDEHQPPGHDLCTSLGKDAMVPAGKMAPAGSDWRTNPLT
jgi:hypothetical protein